MLIQPASYLATAIDSWPSLRSSKKYTLHGAAAQLAKSSRNTLKLEKREKKEMRKKKRKKKKKKAKRTKSCFCYVRRCLLRQSPAPSFDLA